MEAIDKLASRRSTGAASSLNSHDDEPQQPGLTIGGENGLPLFEFAQQAEPTEDELLKELAKKQTTGLLLMQKIEQLIQPCITK